MRGASELCIPPPHHHPPLTLNLTLTTHPLSHPLTPTLTLCPRTERLPRLRALTLTHTHTLTLTITFTPTPILTLTLTLTKPLPPAACSAVAGRMRPCASLIVVTIPRCQLGVTTRSLVAPRAPARRG